MIKKMAIYFKSDKCVKCYACVIACKLVHNYPPHPISPPVAEPEGVSLLRLYEYSSHVGDDNLGFHLQLVTCMHCDDAPCIEECSELAIYKDLEYGVTLTDKEKCIGCEICFDVCPINAPCYDENGKIALCDMCIDRLKAGKKTSCQSVCPAEAIFVGTAEEIRALKDNGLKKESIL